MLSKADLLRLGSATTCMRSLCTYEHFCHGGGINGLASGLMQWDAIAEENRGNQSCWSGFYARNSISVCQLLETGLISKTDTKDYLVGLYLIDDEILWVVPVIPPNHVKSQDSFQGCPLF